MDFFAILQIVGLPFMMLSIIIPFILRQKYKLDFEILEHRTIGPINEDFGITLLVDKDEVKDTVHILTFRLINNGNKDISRTDVIIPVSLTILKGASILKELEITNKKEIGTSKLMNNKILFDIKLLKPNEYIKHKILYVSNKNNTNSHIVNGRVKNVRKIRLLASPLYKNKYTYTTLIIGTIIFILYLLSTYKIIPLFSSKFGILYYMLLYGLIAIIISIIMKKEEKKNEI